MFPGCQDPYTAENFNDLEIDVISRVAPDLNETRTIGSVHYTCDTYFRTNGEIYLICTPVGWAGGDLVLYAHGYISAFEPMMILFMGFILVLE